MIILNKKLSLKMDIDKCIKERRSVRNYKSKNVSWSDISKILEAGVHAPCAGNIQNYNFIVIQDEKKLDSIARAASNQLWMLEASTFIVICSNPEKMKKFYEEEGEHYAVQNCAAAAENMILKAQSLGLRTCWVGSFDEIQLRRILKLPDEVKVETIIVVGYSDSKPKEQKKVPLEKITFFNEWGNTTR